MLVINGIDCCSKCRMVETERVRMRLGDVQHLSSEFSFCTVVQDYLLRLPQLA